MPASQPKLHAVAPPRAPSPASGHECRGLEWITTVAAQTCGLEESHDGSSRDQTLNSVVVEGNALVDTRQPLRVTAGLRMDTTVPGQALSVTIGPLPFGQGARQ